VWVSASWKRSHCGQRWPSTVDVGQRRTTLSACSENARLDVDGGGVAVRSTTAGRLVGEAVPQLGRTAAATITTVLVAVMTVTSGAGRQEAAERASKLGVEDRVDDRNDEQRRVQVERWSEVETRRGV